MIRLSSGLRNALATSYGLSVMLAYGHIQVFTGTQPDTADNTPTGTLLGIVCTDGITPVVGDSAGGLEMQLTSPGVLQQHGNWTLKVAVTGVAGWWRFVWAAHDDGSASLFYPRIDGSVGDSLTLSDLVLGAGALIEDVSFKLTLPSQ
jgi:hypothetical protein